MHPGGVRNDTHLFYFEKSANLKHPTGGEVPKISCQHAHHTQDVPLPLCYSLLLLYCSIFPSDAIRRCAPDTKSCQRRPEDAIGFHKLPQDAKGCHKMPQDAGEDAIVHQPQAAPPLYCAGRGALMDCPHRQGGLGVKVVAIGSGEGGRVFLPPSSPLLHFSIQQKPQTPSTLHHFNIDGSLHPYTMASPFLPLQGFSINQIARAHCPGKAKNSTAPKRECDFFYSLATNPIQERAVACHHTCPQEEQER